MTTSSLAQEVIVGVDTTRTSTSRWPSTSTGGAWGSTWCRPPRGAASSFTGGPWGWPRGCATAWRARVRTVPACRGTCKPRAARSRRFEDPTVSCAGTGASPTPSTPRQLPARCWPAPPRSHPRLATIGWSSCESCASPVVLQFRPEPRPSTRCTPWWSGRPRSCGIACSSFPATSSSGGRPGSASPPRRPVRGALYLAAAGSALPGAHQRGRGHRPGHRAAASEARGQATGADRCRSRGRRRPPGRGWRQSPTAPFRGVLSRPCAVLHRCPLPRVKPPATGSTREATARETVPSGGSP